MRDLEGYIRGIIFTAVLVFIFCGILAFSMHKDRSRYRNTFLVMLAGMSVLGFLCALAGEYGIYAFLICCFLVLAGILMTPLCLILNGIVMLRREGRSLKNLLSLLLGIFVGIGELAGFGLIFLMLIPQTAETMAGTGPSVIHLSEGFALITLTVIYTSLVFVSFMVYTLFLQIIPHKRDFDYVIIHGAGIRGDGTVTRLLADRCDKAVKIYRKDPTPPYLIPSGGKGKDEVRAEAEAMKEYLVGKGIPENKIIPEDQSANTLENLKNSREIIEARPGRHYTALVTSNYHVYRALRYCRRIGFKCTGIGAHVAAYYWPSALIREFVAIHREKKHIFLFASGWLFFVSPVLIGLFYYL